jgi:hypothetical protein
MDYAFSRDEYREIVEMMFIADWVLHATRSEEPDETRGHRDLVDRIYSLAEDFDCGHLIDHDEEADRYFPTDELEEGWAMSKIEEFVNDTFWHELAVRLAERDLIREMGEDAVESMEGADRVQRMGEIEDGYTQEFFDFGLDHVVVGKSPRKRG